MGHHGLKGHPTSTYGRRSPQSSSQQYHYSHHNNNNYNNNNNHHHHQIFHPKNQPHGRTSPTNSHCSSSGYGSYDEAAKDRTSVLDRRRALVYTGLFLLCTVVYWNSLSCDFVFDDITAVVDNRDLRPHVPLKNLFANDFWGTPMSKEQSHKSYRPLTVLTFRWNYWLGEANPLGYHFVNLVLHGLVTLLYFKVCRQLVAASVSLVASLLFALHPIHTEAVTGVVGRAELLASLAYLSAILAFSKAAKKSFPRRTKWTYLLASLMATSLAMLCKEQGITVVAVCVVLEICVRHQLSLSDLVASVLNHRTGGHGNGGHGGCGGQWLRYAFQRICILTFSCIGLLLLRLRLMGATLPVFTKFDNPAAASEAPTKQYTLGYLVSLNTWLLLAPCDLLCDWTMNTVPLVNSFLDVRNMATLALVIGLGWLVKFAAASKNLKTVSVISMGLAMTIFPFIPASNLFFPVGFVVAERILYMPSMGFCLLVAFGWKRLSRWRRKSSRVLCGRQWPHVGLGLLLSLFALKTMVRNMDWQTELSIFTSGLKITQSNAKLLNNVGHALESKAKYPRALQYFLKAIQVQPDDIGGHINVGRVYNHMKRFKEAEEAYLKAKSLLPKSRPGESYQARVAPNHLNVFLNLATLIAQNGSRLEEADLLYRQAISMRSDYTQAYINRGDILLRLNRTEEAKEVYEKALGFENDNPDLLYNMGVVLLGQGKHSEAMAYLDKALEYDPDHYQALLNSAILIQESGSSHLNHVAQERLMRIVNNYKKASSSNSNAATGNGYGNAATTTGGRSSLINERVYFHLAMASMEDKDLEQAEHWFRKAVHVKPDFRSALFNLALLLSESPDQPLAAEPVLHQLLEYYPGHVKGLILLGDLYVNHHGDLAKAQKCYQTILEVDPNNIQAHHNLCVVMVEAGQLDKAKICLEKVASLAPNEAYVNRHLRIVEEKLAQKLQESHHHHHRQRGH